MDGKTKTVEEMFCSRVRGGLVEGLKREDCWWRSKERGPEIKTEDRRCFRRDRERRSGLARFRNFRSAKKNQVR